MNEKVRKQKTVYSLLTLICPGSIKTPGVGRKMAIKTDEKTHIVIDPNKPQKKNAIHLQGCDQDNTTITKWFSKMCKSEHHTGWKSDKSCYDALLKVADAKRRISVWLNEKKADLFVFYYSGHGTDEGGGGLCFDGVLYYKELAKLFGNKHGMIIVDACHAGWIKQSFMNNKNVAVYYACATDEVSADQGLDGGYFTQTYFNGDDLSSLKQLINDNIEPVTHTYSDGTCSDQTCGGYCANSAQMVKQTIAQWTSGFKCDDDTSYMQCNNGILGFDNKGYLKHDYNVKFKKTSGGIKIMDGKWEGYYLGVSGDNDYVKAYKTGSDNTYVSRDGYLYVDGLRVAMHSDGYYYSSNTSGKDDIIRDVKYCNTDDEKEEGKHEDPEIEEPVYSLLTLICPGTK
eukprot:159443_1